MRKISALLIFAILFTLSINAQKRFFKQFEIGAEGGPTLDYLTVRDPAGNLEAKYGLVNGTGGPKIRGYLDRHFFVEAAFLWKGNSFGLRFKQVYRSWSTNASRSFMIPVRVGYGFNFSKKISLNVTAGIVPSFIIFHGGANGFGTTYPAISYSYQMRDEYKKTYVTIQPGISFSHLIKKRIKFSYGVNYYHGLSDVELYDVSYSINNGPVQNAIIANRGSFINYNLGLSYVFLLKRKK